MRYENDDVYEGDFKNDKFEGEGNQIFLKICGICYLESVDWIRCDCQNTV
jgi:hypothetical protein